MTIERAFNKGELTKSDRVIVELLEEILEQMKIMNGNLEKMNRTSPSPS